MKKHICLTSGCIKRIALDQVTLIAVACIRVPETIKALQYSMRGINFAEVLLFTDHRPEHLPEGIKYVEIPKIESIEEYSSFILFEAYRYIKTDYALIVQWDGYVVHPELWNSEFLKYDYIGAPWPEEFNFLDAKGRICRVGNGGASLRSRRLMSCFSNKGMIQTEENEDVYLCCREKVRLENDGFQFAPVEVAVRFSQERRVPETEGVTPFAFHQWEGHNAQYLRFDKSRLFQWKQKLIGFLIRIGIYDRERALYRRLIRHEE